MLHVLFLTSSTRHFNLPSRESAIIRSFADITAGDYGKDDHYNLTNTLLSLYLAVIMKTPHYLLGVILHITQEQKKC